jgi:hypothetical protein
MMMIIYLLEPFLSAANDYLRAGLIDACVGTVSRWPNRAVTILFLLYG